MMKKFLPGALGALMVLASCSQNEVAEINRDGDEIRFNVVTNKATKAADVYCNNNMMEGFYVSALTNGQSYFKDDYVKDEDPDGTHSWKNQNGTRYWPEEGTVDFYAYVNKGTGTFNWNAAAESPAVPATITGFTVEEQVANQVDFLYAVQKEKKKADKEDVTLNFRHALSQIVFQAKNVNPKLYVDIEEVSVVNVSGKAATFTFPTANSDSNIDHGKETEVTPNYSDGSWGKWENLSVLSNYSVNVQQNGGNVEVIADLEGETITDLTVNNSNEGDFSKAMLLLPQSTAAWVPKDYPMPSVEGNTGSYFLVKCRIANVAGASHADTDIWLWGNATTSENIAIPVDFNWEQGKKYIYTFVFGEGNGGYDPEPGPDDPDPEPVLVPITFKVTVDEFILVTMPDTPMDADIE